MDTYDTVCQLRYRIGGMYLSGCHVYDGQKYVCMDELMEDIANNECIVYSFGIGGDWTFEDTIGAFGCKVYAYDPTIDHPKNRSENVKFDKIGVSAETSDDKKYQTLDAILSTNGHTTTKISYLKLDIEGAEMKGLSAWLESGSLDKVQQIAMEVHLIAAEQKNETLEFLQTIKDLHLKGNYRVFNWEANNCWKNYNKNENYFRLAEIVLTKINPEISCAT